MEVSTKTKVLKLNLWGIFGSHIRGSPKPTKDDVDTMFCLESCCYKSSLSLQVVLVGEEGVWPLPTKACVKKNASACILHGSKSCQKLFCMNLPWSQRGSYPCSEWTWWMLSSHPGTLVDWVESLLIFFGKQGPIALCQEDVCICFTLL